MPNNANIAYRLLLYTFVIFLFAIGADKVLDTNLISNWADFIGPLIRFLLPFPDRIVILIEGSLEIIFGIMLLTPWRRISLVLLVITITMVNIDLYALHYYNLAIRDVMLTVVCVAMYLLDERTP